jgi:tRNA-dihydrouridine synthase A
MKDTSHNNLSRRISVAPMMDWTDRHCRYFLRLITKKTLLYTEMINAKALVHGDALNLLDFNAEEHPLALQLGGNVPEELAIAAKLGEEAGYDEINLNVGCPSDRVQSGAFGACLMLKPELVKDCVAAMQDKISVPVTVKCRIGVDKQESYDFLHNFVEVVSSSGCNTFIIHARNAWLQGLSPKENRNIPPLRYDIVYQLKQNFPDLEIIINGGITRYEQISEHLRRTDGVMLGREAYHNPYILSEIDSRYYSVDEPIITRAEVLKHLIDYAQQQVNNDIYLKHITRHILGLFHGQPGARQWRRHLSEYAVKRGATIDVIKKAAEFVL